MPSFPSTQSMTHPGGNLHSTSINGVKTYTISSNRRYASSLLPAKKARALCKDPGYRTRVDLVQDLRFETATTKIKVTPDGEYIIASGIYPPQVKVYEVSELSLKFERHLVSEIVNFQILMDDYSKIAFLCADRSVCFHAKYGSHYSLRIPRVGRDITYDCRSCDLLCAASSPDLYRINLQQGQFLSPLVTRSPALNVVSQSNQHGLVACGGEDGAVECFDLRMRSSVGRIDALLPSGDPGQQEVTALEMDDHGGFLMSVGSSGGKVLIYDLRSSTPLLVKDHMYDSPILDIKWHHAIGSQKRMLITTDEHTVRIWDPDNGKGMTSIEPSGGSKINDTCVFGGSGLMLLALDCSEIPPYFVPALGQAPKWCSYLDNMTEEMEEGAATTVYDDYKFVTMEDLQKLNLTNLIGTSILRAYMHGFFIDSRLYRKARSLANPFEYEEYIEQRKKEKLEKQRASRITLLKKLPKANRRLAARILEEEEEEEDEESDKRKKKKKKKKGMDREILEDERFASVFENKDYEIDEESEEYRARYRTGKTEATVREHFDPIMEEYDGGDDGDDDSSAQDERGDGIAVKQRGTQPRLYEVKDERHAEAFWSGMSLRGEDALSMGERAAALPRRDDVKVRTAVGSREISFNPGKIGKGGGTAAREHSKERRGVGSLRLKSLQPNQRGRGHRGRRPCR